MVVLLVAIVIEYINVIGADQLTENDLEWSLVVLLLLEYMVEYNNINNTNTGANNTRSEAFLSRWLDGVYRTAKMGHINELKPPPIQYALDASFCCHWLVTITNKTFIAPRLNCALRTESTSHCHRTHNKIRASQQRQITGIWYT